MWYIGYVRSSEELSLRDDLRRDGQEVYTPTTERQIRRNGRKAMRTVAAFTGYLFIYDPGRIEDRRFYGFLMIDGERASMTDEQMDGIRLLERLGAFQTHAESEKALGIGEAVKVSTGLLQGLRGTIDEPLRGKDRSVRVSGGDFAKPMWLPSVLLLPESTVQ